ncbi:MULTISPECIES: lipid kinase YegS [Stenotrophomonas]|uniref:lipid kinase YegS n=1 Tax=Stenotrophomonas TaxID=40323 RepID=UPI0007703776|nr:MULTISPECIES: lipid kinase YegS [Stenotrophomonas]AMJ57925.1 lipid kinase YegS [Stenotrophomonas sp. KCTC 12332]
MQASPWFLILNGKSAGDDAVREAVAQLREQGQDVRVRVTWESGDAERYVREAIAAQAPLLIAGGGDGTLSEVAEAMAHTGQDAAQLPALALLPLGTANDFATAAGIPPEPLAALQLPGQTPARLIDLLRVDGDGRVHWCANLASGGFGTEVTVETHDGLKKMLGGLAYVITGIAKLGRIEPIQARIHAQGFDWQGGFIALGVGNGRQAGGGQQLCPEALLDDGRLDLTVVPELSGEVMSTLGTLFSEGKHAALEQVAERARLSEVWIEAEQPLTLNLDGEPLQARRFHLQCVAGRVRMHLPADTPLLGG